MAKISKGWLEAFESGVGCDSCGAPMMTIPNEEDPNTGTYICIPCTWAEDHYQLGLQDGRKSQYDKMHARINALEDTLQQCRETLQQNICPPLSHPPSLKGLNYERKDK